MIKLNNTHASTVIELLCKENAALSEGVLYLEEQVALQRKTIETLETECAVNRIKTRVRK